jgi:signal transduction histidine kinase
MVYDLILTFILFSHQKDNASLVLFLTDVSKKDTDSLQQSIQLLYGNLNITNIFSKIALIPINSTLDNFIACHKSGNIFLNLNDDTKQSMQANYAKLYNNQIIDLNNVETEYRFNRNDTIGDNLMQFPTQQSILQAYQDIENINKSNNEHTTYPIEQIIWN